MNSELNTAPTIQEHINIYKEISDPLLMMGILMELGRTRRHDLTDEEYRQISCCHNLLAAISRND